jgi:hypothetical protein
MDLPPLLEKRGMFIPPPLLLLLLLLLLVVPVPL